MRFRHLDYPEDRAIDQLGPAALDALLDHGDLDAWRPLRDAIRDDPFGPLADTVLRLCAAHRMYGTSPMWTTWIERVRSRKPRSLAELRRSTGLTQVAVARLIGSTQSDVSKFERRDDVRVSSLRGYVEAIGATLVVLARFGEGDGSTVGPFG